MPSPKIAIVAAGAPSTVKVAPLVPTRGRGGAARIGELVRPCEAGTELQRAPPGRWEVRARPPRPGMPSAEPVVLPATARSAAPAPLSVNEFCLTTIPWMPRRASGPERASKSK